MRIYKQRTSAANVLEFERPGGMSEVLHRLLIRRGITSADAAERFLNPSVQDLNDPFLLSGMDEAVALIQGAVHRAQRICVYGDYDVDGVSASAILFGHLKQLGAEVEVYLPSRHTEGYGLNEAAVREISTRCQLLITVDCGITNVELVQLAKELGMQVVVTDHHRPAKVLPDCPVVNPLLEGYPFGYLCGAGVAFQLVAALSGRAASLEYVDLAAIATVADIVSLTGENRAIVALGLKAINSAPRLGVQALISAAGLDDKEITAGNIAFQLAPRLNAGGRLDSAHKPLELLTAVDGKCAQDIAEELNQENAARKELEQEILEAALAQLEDFDFPAHRAIVLSGKGWNHGVIGLAASRLVEMYHYPTILMADDGEQCTGSCRSISGVDIHAALTAVSEHLVRFGGHKQAAGLTMESSKVDQFARDIDAYLEKEADPLSYVPSAEYDMEVPFSALGDLFVESLDALQPTGMGNPAPVFRALAEVREARAVGRDGAHLKLRLLQDGKLLDAICFREGGLAAKLKGEQDLLFTPKINSYMGRISVQLELKAIGAHDNVTQISANISNEPRLLRHFLTDILYNRTYLREDSSAQDISQAQISELLTNSLQGTLILCADLASAGQLMQSLGDISLDFKAGVYPDDSRAFNALCCYAVGEMPTCYRQVIAVDLPLVCDFAQVYHLSTGGSAWQRELPNIDELRDLYRALRRMGSRPLYARTLDALCVSLSAESGFGNAKCLAGLLALEDMKLCNLNRSGDEAQLEICPMRKSDPMDSAVFQRICMLKGEA